CRSSSNYGRDGFSTEWECKKAPTLASGSPYYVACDLLLCLFNLCQAAGVEHHHGHHLIKHPPLPEAFHLMVLLHVQGVQNREDSQEVGLGGQEHIALRHHDGTLNLELTERGDRLTRHDTVLERPTGLVDVPAVQVAEVERVDQQPARLEFVHVGHRDGAVQRTRRQVTRHLGDRVVRSHHVVRTVRVVGDRGLEQHQQAGVLLLQDGLLGLILGLLHRVDPQVQQVFLADHRERGDPEEPHRNPLALERGHPDLALGAVHHVRLSEVVPDVVLDRGTRGHRVLDQDVTGNSLVPQLELNGTDHPHAQAGDAVGVLQDQGHLLDFGFVGERLLRLFAVDDLLYVIIRLSGGPTPPTHAVVNKSSHGSVSILSSHAVRGWSPPITILVGETIFRTRAIGAVVLVAYPSGTRRPALAASVAA